MRLPKMRLQKIWNKKLLRQILLLCMSYPKILSPSNKSRQEMFKLHKFVSPFKLWFTLKKHHSKKWLMKMKLEKLCRKKAKKNQNIKLKWKIYLQLWWNSPKKLKSSPLFSKKMWKMQIIRMWRPHWTCRRRKEIKIKQKNKPILNNLPQKKNRISLSPAKKFSQSKTIKDSNLERFNKIRSLRTTSSQRELRNLLCK